MRIKSIELSWFRGAADQITLEPNCKSMVIYGVNGSGKSSFVDSIEYILNNGRINHLAHEYSGRNQEKAIHNTHKPKELKTKICVNFENVSILKTEILPNGRFNKSGDGSSVMDNWDYRSTILRQDEVSSFIHDTKGEKFSVLLPLLGLDELVNTTENLKQINKSFEGISKVKDNKAFLTIKKKAIEKAFGSDNDENIVKKLGDLYEKYCSERYNKDDLFTQCNEIIQVISKKSSQFSSEYDRFQLLRNIGNLNLQEEIDSVRSTSSKIANSVDPLILEKIRILESAEDYASKVNNLNDLVCPACGQSISFERFQSHIKIEHERLQEIITFHETRKIAINAFCKTLTNIQTYLQNEVSKSWIDELNLDNPPIDFRYISDLDVDNIRKNCEENDLSTLEKTLIPLIKLAKKETLNAPLATQDLLKDKELAEAGLSYFEVQEKTNRVRNIEAMVAFLGSLEQDIRKRIKTKTEEVIDEISSDIQNMWSILHPENTIKGVRLYFPPDEDKAIDISLEFFGVDQPSPRMTLSEGYRNSLGLSIFLSMAKRKSINNQPIFLDDVIVSLDRNHRGMVAELLKKEFSDRQVIIFTHDRDWYTELKYQLDNSNWSFKTFLPYDSPELGIRWSHKTTTFDEVRSLIKQNPDTAGNNVRKIMDIELAIISEKLRINLPYLRGEKNDMRHAHDFLQRIRSEGNKRFKKRNGNNYEVYKDAINTLLEADNLLVTWGNRASHTFDIVPAEAENLTKVCESALEVVKCKSCSKYVWYSNSESSELLQCNCGEICWKYG